MNDDKKHLQNEMPSKWKRLLKKRWFYPAVYLGLAALVITVVLWTQIGSNVAEQQDDTTAHNDTEEAIPTAQHQELFVEPILADDVEVQTPFYDPAASAEEQESALVFYNNKYHQNQGIDYTRTNGETFDVTAAMSGKVTKAEKDALLGHVVEIEHANGVTTVYQSLENVNVSEGDDVEQGDVIGQAGQNTFNKEAGIHLHFEIRKDGMAVNPIDFFGKSVADIPNVEEQQEAQREKEAQSEEEAQTDEIETDSESDSENEARQRDASRSMTNA